MTGLSALWLPILVSAAVVFVLSSIIHMALGYHKADYPAIPNEDRVMDALRPLAIPPGDYMVPRPGSPKDMKSDAFKAKVAKGPVFMMTVFPPLPGGQASMGKSLMQWFVYCLVVGVFAAYIAGRALPAGSEFAEVVRFAGGTAFIAYSLAQWQASIWYHRAWGTTIRNTIDGLIYGLATGAVFGWLWPV